jgi:hypothetical protein
MLAAVVVLQFLAARVWVVVVMLRMVNLGWEPHMVADVLLLMVIMEVVLLQIEKVLGHNMEFMVQAVAEVQDEQIRVVREVQV